MRTIGATKLEVLAFIKLKEIVEAWQLCEEFGYSPVRARERLSRLKKGGLLENPIRGKWCLTELGHRRLAYLEKRSEKR